jgi:hypothetical protein
MIVPFVFQRRNISNIFGAIMVWRLSIFVEIFPALFGREIKWGLPPPMVL